MELSSSTVLLLMLLALHVITAQEPQAPPESRPTNLAISVHNANVTNTSGRVYMADLKILLHGLGDNNEQEDSNQMIEQKFDELATGMVRLGRVVTKLTETVQNVMEQLPELIKTQITVATAGIDNNEGVQSEVPSPVCPEPFFSVFGECFYANVHQKLSWAQARHFCEGVGSDLAEPRDVNLLRLLLQEKFLSKTVVSFWLGAKKFKVKEAGNEDGGSGVEWQWLSGLPVGDSNWIRGQPDNRFGEEDCLAMMKSFQPPLHDITCTHPDYFVCERKFTNPSEEPLA